ncbi:hypothetical protein BAUCODRAFT_31836 [Baudoinia panamericana UAMH 10762]|uniref:Uncharacterized protein n=1 Tax=Baudoinia panamericana (strain UAMH 10762) TaxID=717646 RepID=M2MMA5_BAUPA|nr:uncharacterized protein BAUCODRAFT_31836 [Baudoinia panamericana UAMH 10762]EMC97826.1 hypothetical protein BAUCODRAFT_31836 [Baudoinia panamericana UAMH 10762]
MVKSNPFDYTNKKNTGIGLGQFIAKQLEKEAKKQATRARKQSLSSAMGSVDGHEGSSSHGLDIKLPGKELGDAGFNVLAECLEAVLSVSEEASDVPLILEQIDLSNNQLTAASLPRLATVIEQAKHDLQLISVANNELRIETDQDIERWDTFLCAFGDCEHVSKLDLAGNGLGGRAIESLAKWHIRQSFKAPVSGIRNIDPLILNNIALNESGALWLSYVLENHASEIDWAGNETSLSRDSQALLRKAEAVRKQMVTASQNSGCDEEEAEGVSPMEVPRGARRASGKFGSSSEIDAGGSSELDSLRKKIQRHIIMHDKPASVDLWRAALKLLHFARMFSLVCKRPSPIAPSPVRNPVIRLPPSSPTPKSKKDTRKLSVSADKENVGRKDSRGSHAMTGKPQVALEVTNMPIPPNMVSKPHRKGAFSHCADPEPVRERLQGLIMRDDNPERFLRWQNKRIAAQGASTFWNNQSAFHLSVQLTDPIAVLVLGKREMEMMTEKQRHAVIAWGLNRDTLATERGWTGKDESSQVWMLLDSITCLEYEQ